MSLIRHVNLRMKRLQITIRCWIHGKLITQRLSRINNSVVQSIGTQLAKYDTTTEVWDHLERLYTQSNSAKQYPLETDIRALRQNHLSVKEL